MALAAQKVATRSAVASRRSSVVVRASAESRRAVLLSGVAGVLSLAASGKALAAATPVDLFDDRKVRSTGFDLIYEARDLDLPQNVRDGLEQARKDLAGTKNRVKESEARVDSALEPSIQKKYWVEAREELRRQVGTLRFDLNTLASAKGGKAEKKAALAKKDDFLKAVEDLDFALREKDQASALKSLTAVKSSLDAVLATVL